MVVPVELRGKRRSVKTMAMIDCGATSIFIHKRFIDQHNVQTIKLDKPIPLVNADDTANKIGAISEQHQQNCISLNAALGRLISFLAWSRESHDGPTVASSGARD